MYLDNILVFGSDFEITIERLTQVLDHQGKAGVKLKAKKCQLLREETPFLGHIVSGGHVTSPGEATLCRACRSVRSLLRENNASLNDSQAVRLCGCLEELAHSHGCRQRNGVSFRADPRILVARVHRLVHFSGRDQLVVLRAIL